MTILPSGPPEPATPSLLPLRYKRTNIAQMSRHATISTTSSFSSSRIRARNRRGSGSAAAMGSLVQKEAVAGVDLRLLAARAVTEPLRAVVSGSSAGEKAARLEECIRSLEAEKAKMEVFRRELPISVHLVGDVIELLKDELEQHQRPPPEMFALAPAPAPKRKAEEQVGGVKTEVDANDKRSWMSSAQLWSYGSHNSTSNSNGGSVKKQAHKVANAFMPLMNAKSPEKPEKAAMPPVPDLPLSSPAIDAPCPAAAPSANSSAITDAGAQRKARRCWSPELHRRFVAALQRLGGPQAATPKQIRELMKVDGLTNDEVKSHLQKFRLHMRRASDGDQQAAGLWPPPEKYTASQHSTSQSGSPQGPLQLTGSSRGAVSVTAGDSCEGWVEEDGGKSESYSWEMQNGPEASPSS